MGDLLAGLYIGIVQGTNDPDHRARVLVSVPALGSDTSWALPCVPYAASRAATKVPPVGAQVWIAFTGGRRDEPVWIGVLPRR